jgi:hypothetical protein
LLLQKTEAETTLTREMLACLRMTWIVGGPGFVSPFLAGDICVTFRHANGREETHDCLQKIYPLARNVLGGFAGSVDIGLRMLTAIAQDPGIAVLNLPRLAVRWFPRFARRFFSQAPPAMRKLGCEILMVGIHPYLQQPLTPFQRTDAVRFVAPHFEAQEMTTNPMNVLGIGSGQVLDDLRSAALAAVRSNGFHRMEDFQFAGGVVNREGDLQLQLKGGFAGPAAKMAFALRQALTKFPAPGVSKWFVYGAVSVTDPPVIEAPVYASVTHAGAQERLAPPPFAAGLEAYLRFLKANGLAATAAVG